MQHKIVAAVLQKLENKQRVVLAGYAFFSYKTTGLDKNSSNENKL
jgi:hypothetical protein